MYWLCYSFLLFPFCFVEKQKEIKLSYFLFSAILVFFLVFRYGIGVDYFNYYHIYESYSFNSSFQIPIEPIFGLLCSIFNYLHVPFPFFMGMVSFFSVLPVLKDIYNNSEKPLLSIFIFFTMYYSVYYESAIRAGCVISLFIFGYFNYLRKNQKGKYYIISIIAIGFHYSAFILLFIPFIKKLDSKVIFNSKNLFIFMLLCFILSIFVKKILFLVIPVLFPKYVYYLGNENFSISYLTVAFCFVRALFLQMLIKNKKVNELEKLDIKIYLTGILLYLLLSTFSISSRLTDILLVMEVFIIPRYIRSSINGKILLFFILLFCDFMLYKDIKSFLIYGDYYQNSIRDYSYVSVFNKSKISNLKRIPYYDNLTFLFNE